MKKTLLFVTLLIITATFFTISVAVLKDEDIEKDMEVDTEEIDLKKQEGLIAKKLEYEGEKYMITFFLTLCPPCVNELGEIDELKREGYNIIVVNVSTLENFENVDAGIKEFMEAEKLDFEVILDKDGKLKEKYNIEGTPTNFIIDETGNIQERIHGRIYRENIIEKLGGENNDEN